MDNKHYLVANPREEGSHYPDVGLQLYMLMHNVYSSTNVHVYTPCTRRIQESDCESVAVFFSINTIFNNLPFLKPLGEVHQSLTGFSAVLRNYSQRAHVLY